MYGFGDEREVFTETVLTLEDAIQDYVADVVGHFISVVLNPQSVSLF